MLKYNNGIFVRLKIVVYSFFLRLQISTWSEPISNISKLNSICWKLNNQSITFISFQTAAVMDRAWPLWVSNSKYIFGTAHSLYIHTEKSL
jgi:hypothetical protein